MRTLNCILLLWLYVVCCNIFCTHYLCFSDPDHAADLDQNHGPDPVHVNPTSLPAQTSAKMPTNLSMDKKKKRIQYNYQPPFVFPLFSFDQSFIFLLSCWFFASFSVAGVIMLSFVPLYLDRRITCLQRGGYLHKGTLQCVWIPPHLISHIIFSFILGCLSKSFLTIHQSM